jgi:hypothetical protein
MRTSWVGFNQWLTYKIGRYDAIGVDGERPDVGQGTVSQSGLGRTPRERLMVLQQYKFPARLLVSKN